MKTRLANFIAACAVFSAVPLLACSIPVFRYALERWSPDLYEVVVFYRGQLEDAHEQLVHDMVRENTAREPAANVLVRIVDLDEENGPELEALWASQHEPALPWMVVRFPKRAPVQTPIWSGSLTADAVETLLDSPVRRQVAERLLAGDSTVWVLLESGDTQQDDEAFQTLQTRTAVLETTLKLPEIDAADINAGLLSVSPNRLQLKFSVVRVSRDDPRERWFVDMLLGVEDDLRDEAFVNQPMAFPVFGRGRALYALVGKGINDEMIHTACEFLSGSCSCTVKEQNPGVDLLMSVGWESAVEPQFDDDKPLPPLTGLGTFADLADENAEAVAEAPATNPEPISGDTHAFTPADSTAAVQTTSAANPRPTRSLAWNLLLVGTLALVGVAAMSFVLINRKS